MKKYLPLAFSVLALTGCTSSTPKVDSNPSRYTQAQDGAPTQEVDIASIPNAIPRTLPKSKYGNPVSYSELGKTYYVLPSAKGYNERGIASWYGTKFHNQRTSSGEPYDMYAMTAASPVLPIPSFVRVTNLTNNRSVVVKVNDRGPFHDNRILDLSYVAAKKLDYADKGTALVQVTAISPEQAKVSPPVAKGKPPAHQPILFIQVGAFSEQGNASKLQKQLENLTQQAVSISTAAGSQQTIYKVQVGPLATVAVADKVVNEIEQAGLGTPITIVQ